MNDANKIDKETIESVLNQVKEYCEKNCYICGLCGLEEFCERGNEFATPNCWDTKKIAEVLSDDK